MNSHIPESRTCYILLSNFVHFELFKYIIQPRSHIVCPIFLISVLNAQAVIVLVFINLDICVVPILLMCYCLCLFFLHISIRLIDYPFFFHINVCLFWSGNFISSLPDKEMYVFVFFYNLWEPVSSFPCNAALLTLHHCSWCMGGTTAPQHQLGSMPWLGHRPQFNRQINLALLE